MIRLLKDGYKKKTEQDRLNYGLQLKKALEDFTRIFLPHMKEEEEVCIIVAGQISKHTINDLLVHTRARKIFFQLASPWASKIQHLLAQRIYC